MKDPIPRQPARVSLELYPDTDRELEGRIANNRGLADSYLAELRIGHGLSPEEVLDGAWNVQNGRVVTTVRVVADEGAARVTVAPAEGAGETEVFQLTPEAVSYRQGDGPQQQASEVSLETQAAWLQSLKNTLYDVVYPLRNPSAKD